MRTRAVVGAYLVACLVGAILLSFCIVLLGSPLQLIFILAPLLALWIALLAALPASAAIFYAERHCYRSPGFYAAAGFATVIVAAVEIYLTGGLPAPGRRHVPGGFRETMQLVVLFGSFPGVAAGLVYWSIAGRNAGKAPYT